MFEHYILGIPRVPIPSTSTHPFSPGALSNVSPGTCLPPSTNSYFPLFSERRPSAHRLSSLDGLENALAAMEKGNMIEKDEVDTGVCTLEYAATGETERMEGGMFLAGEEIEDREGKQEDKQHTMMRRRRKLRGREERRLAMLTDHVECSSAEQFVEEVERQGEDCALAFRTRVNEVVEDYIPKKATAKEPSASDDISSARNAINSEDISIEPAQPRRHSTFYPSPPHTSHDFLDEEQLRPRSSSVNGPPPHWLKEYSSSIGRAHILERRKSLSTANGGVLHARVCKKICQRRGM